MENYYQVLDLPPNASQEQIKERFRFLAQAYHPDKFATSAHKNYAEEAFKKINDAYQILSNSLRRAEYDRGQYSSDSNYEGERRRKEETEAAQHHAEEERRKREETEAAQRRAKAEQQRREQAEAQRRAAEAQRKREETGQLLETVHVSCPKCNSSESVPSAERFKVSAFSKMNDPVASCGVSKP